MIKIYITGTIDEDSFQSFSKYMDEAEERGEDNIEIILNSTGGSALDALAFYERIKASASYTAVTVYGACYSAAVLVLVAGQKRRMTKTSWLMVHEDTYAMDEGDSKSTSLMEVEAQYMRRMENQWNYLLAKRSRLSAKVWERLHKKTTYMNAKECLEAGIIEEII